MGSKTNKEIIKSADSEPAQFFLYNNGISCLATNVSVADDGVSVTGLQVINGAQTVKAIVHVAKSINRMRKDVWNQIVPQILVRITEIPEGYCPNGRARERITQFNNTQNTVKISDFRSNDVVQQNLKDQFATLTRRGKRVCYLPKRTDRLPPNSEPVKLEELSKAVYTFSYDFVEFSGSTSFLFNDDDKGGYQKVFGDGKNLWEQMPDDEFKLRAAIYWISQELYAHLRKTRAQEADADSRAAIERKWPLLYAFSCVVKLTFAGDDWKNQIRKFYKGDWSMDDDDNGKIILDIYNRAKMGVIMAYKADKRNNNEFVHRNWMRSKNTPNRIRETLEVALPTLPPLKPISS